MLDAVDRLSAGGAENLDRVGIFAAWEIERRAGGARFQNQQKSQDQHYNLKCPTIPFKSVPNCASSTLDLALSCIANAA